MLIASLAGRLIAAALLLATVAACRPAAPAAAHQGPGAGPAVQPRQTDKA